MAKNVKAPAIRLRGVRQNNLKNFDLDLPLGELIVITGLSGSGKSSLAFDTLFAEGQRRYIETFSPYTRQFFDRMDKPKVDSIEGIPPAIAIEQKNSVKTTRSTVGTMTEVCDHMKLLWPRISQLYCRQCGQRVRKEPPQAVWEELQAHDRTGGEVLLAFEVQLSAKVPLAEAVDLIQKQGFQRLMVPAEDGKVLGTWRVLRVEEWAATAPKSGTEKLWIVQDRLSLEAKNRSRFCEGIVACYHYGKERAWVFSGKHQGDGVFQIEAAQKFSAHFHCATCDIEYREPIPPLFSFNHPLGACPDCRGFGRVIAIDYKLAVPDWSKTLAEGVVKPWQTGQGAECQTDLMKFCRKRGIPTNVPFEQLEEKWRRMVLDGDEKYGKDAEHQWPKAWYGVAGYFRWLESKAYKMHVRVLLSRYRSYIRCAKCEGKRLQPESLLHRVISTTHGGEKQLSLSDFYLLPLGQALQFIQQIRDRSKFERNDPANILLSEVEARLKYLVEVGLGYLTLDRTTRTLSGGETARVNLTACLGSRLVNTLFVLDEPSVGLHSRDIERLVSILTRLRDLKNTVVVVEHEANVIRSADRVVDIGPGHGENGGQLCFVGRYADLLKAKGTLTGDYLSGRRSIVNESMRDEVPGKGSWLGIERVTLNNLVDVSVTIPLGRLVAVTGVSGSGKSTLVREVLAPLLAAKISGQRSAAIETEEEEGDDPTESSDVGREARLIGDWATLGSVVMVDQSALGKTPRSNPAVYIGAFDDIRNLFGTSEEANAAGLQASAFSFNSKEGQCERCRGAGFEKIEMQFLSDIFIRCPECEGRRYRKHVLAVKISPDPTDSDAKALSIGDLLEATVDEVVDWLAQFSKSKPAARARVALALLQEVGLGYLHLGQPINTLSGGESQRLKLVSHIAEFSLGRNMAGAKPTIFFFDEPTTGLHFEDVRILLLALQKLVDAGHSVVVIEHNLEVIKCADWVIDLGPEAGSEGGKVVVAGTPETVAACEASHTGKALRAVMNASSISQR